MFHAGNFLLSLDFLSGVDNIAAGQVAVGSWVVKEQEANVSSPLLKLNLASTTFFQSLAAGVHLESPHANFALICF